MLDVPIKPLALRRLLGDRAGEVSAALRPLPVDIDLWDADDAVLTPLTQRTTCCAA